MEFARFCCGDAERLSPGSGSPFRCPKWSMADAQTFVAIDVCKYWSTVGTCELYRSLGLNGVVDSDLIEGNATKAALNQHL